MKILKTIATVLGSLVLVAIFAASLYLSYQGYLAVQEEKRAAVERIYPHDPELALRVRGMGNMASTVPFLAIFAFWLVMVLLFETHRSPESLRAEASIRERLRVQRLREFGESLRRR